MANDKEAKDAIKKIKDDKKPLTVLNLSNKSFSEKVVNSLFESLKSKRKLTELNVARSSVRAHHLLKLPHNTSLRKLILAGNVLGNEKDLGIEPDEGIVNFAKRLEKDTSLTELDLSDTHIGLVGIVALAEALKENTCIQKLDLSNFRKSRSREDITTIVWKLVEMLQVNKTLTSLGLRLNHLEVGHKEALEKAIAGRKLTLDLEGNNFDTPSVQLGEDSEEKSKESKYSMKKLSSTNNLLTYRSADSSRKSESSRLYSTTSESPKPSRSQSGSE